jgi:type II secretory pathway pseudopilin PulG
MRIYPQLRVADAKEMSRQGELGFTMIEIAIAIGVIGFALVAIIGILPAGMEVQKDNREDTLISQDAPYFLDAIRNGAPLMANGLLPNFNAANYPAHGLDFLTNYVQSIRFDYISPTLTNTLSFSNFTSGAQIIGLLSNPQNNYNNPFFSSNYIDITATVRALSGPATEQQTGANTGVSSAMAFTYQMEVMIIPFNNVATYATNWSVYGQSANADLNYSNILYNRWWETTPGNIYVNSSGVTNYSGALQYNLFDVRLRFSWPVLANGRVGPGRQTYRTLVPAQLQRSGDYIIEGGQNTFLWFFQPQIYSQVNNAL